MLSGRIFATGWIVCLALVCMGCERSCRPLELKVVVTSAKDPSTGRSWDRGPKARQAPDPVGYVVVTTKGKRYGEKIAQRKDTYGFRGRFYTRRGAPLLIGSTIEAVLKDKDLTNAAPIGRIKHRVLSTRSGSAKSRNGALKLEYTCHSR